MKIVAHARDFLCRRRAQRRMQRLQKILISSALFAMSNDARAFDHRACTQRCVKQTARVAHAPTRSKRAPRTRFVKQRLFFSLCCSKSNAVRVDSRPY
jgi:hypothetical protein